MEVAASGLAVVSLALQLTEACTKLHKFWESIEDAPQEIAAIKEDLLYLTSVFGRIGCTRKPLGHCVVEGIQHCQIKVTNVLDYFDKIVPEESVISRKIQELMLHAIGQTAIATFESTSTEIFARDGYTMDDSGVFRSKTFVYSRHMRYRVCHQASSFRLAFGCVWIRTTTIYYNDRVTDTHGKSQSVTAFTFYPNRWVQRLGVKNGLEAIMASGGKSWMINCRLTLTRAIPEDAPIFELCRSGQTRAVEVLLSKGIGSVVDTSPKGWKPLHFAAAGGHVDLCAMLIREGADKTALVYEGPAPSILLFSDCIDLAGPSDDGWTVHEWLKRAYAKERVPISRNSITWLLHLTAKEEYVVFGARTIWCGLQHGIRSILGHEQNSRFLYRIMDLSEHDLKAVSRTHINAIGFWLALRICGRELLPMAVKAGSFLQMKGFDWVEDDITQKQFLKALPELYTAWCHTLLDCVGKAEDYMRLELEVCIEKMGWKHDVLLSGVSCKNTFVEDFGRKNLLKRACTRCKDDYSTLGLGLIEPARIAVTECIRSNHKFKCICRKNDDNGTNSVNVPLPAYSTEHDSENSDTEEEFFDAASHLIVDPSFSNQHSSLSDISDIFNETAILLYQSHGRVWMGNYEIGEHLCATCFLLEEQYISEDGLGTDFPSMPESFEGLRIKQHLEEAYDDE
ncbi:hypothetical protein BKA66DRAFT_585814 [Pyrenochaeta sp. MPI-SDFR-AT-0127]|nr:hypothetical protein BKA66DRAFT_585814 [Pyrenochaeta sp. MPI-SDFR-AT-0127]